MKNKPYLLIIVLFIIFFIHLIFKNKQHENFYNIHKNKLININCNASKIRKEKCQLSKDTNSFKCFLNQCDTCPMSSYKQCTNNYPSQYYPPLSSCTCKNRNFELCPDLYRSSNSCMINNLKKCNSCEYHYKIPDNNPRVNFWRNLPDTENL